MTDTSRPALDQLHDFAPAGYHTVTPYLAVRDASATLDFYQRAFGATVLSRMDGDDGTVMHAEVLIGDSVIQVSDEFPQMGLVVPADDAVNGSFSVYVADVDATHAAAAAAGATVVSGVEDVFSGDRMGIVRCPGGHRWVILTRKEHVDDAEVERRAREWVAAGSQHASPDTDA